MKFNKFATALVASAVLAFGVGSADAATYQFTLTGDYSASWQLDSTVIPDDAATGEGATVWDVVGTYPGATTNLADITFYNRAVDGGIQLYDFYGDNVLLLTDGPQLYTGDEEDQITFLTGSFALSEYGGSGAYNLTIRDLSAAAVPEPASIAMLLAGIGLVGTMARRRRNGKVAAL